MNLDNNKMLQEELCVHFDTNEHRIPIDVFLTTGSSICKISKDFNKKFFDNHLSPEIYVVPPKNGGFIEFFNFVIINHPFEIGVSSWLCNLLLKRYTDKKLMDWIELGGNLTLDELENEVKRIKNCTDNFLMNTKVALKLYVNSLQRFIISDSDKLRTWEITPQEFRNSFEAKNNFYESCLQPKTGIKGIGVSKKHIFPVKRNDFSSQIVRLPLTEDDVYYKLQKIIITNPTIVDDNTPWTGRIASNSKKITFFMEDENFKDMLIKGLSPIKASNLDDEMLVYLEYRTTHGNNLRSKQRISAKVVYKFNDKVLQPIPGDIKIDIPQHNNNPQQLNLI